jgi:hypothetical protein
VLSGFLITGILLDQRTLLETGESNTWEILSIFYKRRALRIWPVMFFTLALVWLAGNRFERQDDMLYHMLFSSNILFFLRGEFCSSLAHFWTLAVEQQFYLVWPFVILFTRRSRLEFAIIAAIAIAPLFRLALFTEGFTQFAQFNVFPLGNTDSLGTGSLMAFWLRKPAEDLEIRWRWFRRAVGSRFYDVVTGESVPDILCDHFCVNDRWRLSRFRRHCRSNSRNAIFDRLGNDQLRSLRVSRFCSSSCRDGFKIAGRSTIPSDWNSTFWAIGHSDVAGFCGIMEVTRETRLKTWPSTLSFKLYCWSIFELKRV